MANKNDYLIKQNNTLNFNSNFLNDKYDEPTYLTFRVNFFPNNIERPSNIQNINTLPNNDIERISYDDIPQPLLELSLNSEDYDYIIQKLSFEEINDFNFFITEGKRYSTIDYLLNSIGDLERGVLLVKFIILLMKLNWDFPYYIKSIEGLNELLSVDPKRGSRIKKDTVLTLKCYEGLDQRISTLKNLYKKIAWDETFQRWILPDMMRFFKMDIYISEFRIFHEYKGKKIENKITPFNVKKGSKLDVINTIKNTLNTVGKLFGTDKSVGQNAWSLIHSSINASMPTTKIECRMCEFDISNLFSNLSSLSSSNPKEKPVDDLEIKIKVGNIKEVNYNGLLDKDNEIYIDDEILSYKKLYRKKEDKKENFKRDIEYARTGIMSFNTNETQMFNDDVKSRTMSYLEKAIKNTLKGALDYADNLADRELNKLMMNKMGKSGLSFNDVLTAVTSANINTMYNTFKIKAEAAKELYPEISMATNDKTDIKTFESFINNVAKSEDVIQSTIAKSLLEWGKENATTIEDYMNIISEATKTSSEEQKLLINFYESIIKENKNLNIISEVNTITNEEQNVITELYNELTEMNKNKKEELSTATKEDNTIETKIIL